MPNYKEMYLTMVRATESAINMLIQAQRKCEEMYVDSSDEEEGLPADTAELGGGR